MFVDLLGLAHFANNYWTANTSGDYNTLSIFTILLAQWLTCSLILIINTMCRLQPLVYYIVLCSLQYNDVKHMNQ